MGGHRNNLTNHTALIHGVEGMGYAKPLVCNVLGHIL